MLIAAVAGTFSALYPEGMYFVFLVLAGASGLLIGVLSTPDPGPLQAAVIALAGSFVGANIALIVIAGGTIWLRQRFDQHWTRIALRVIAAWIATISILAALLSIAATRL